MRLIKFAGVGLSCAFVQLLALHLLVVAGIEEHVSNLLAFALSVQVNFLLSQFFTRQDRSSLGLRPKTLGVRLLMFNASASSTGLVNQSVFAVANLSTSYIAAATIGIAVAAILNFTLNDKLVFRKAILKPGVVRPSLPQGERSTHGPSLRLTLFLIASIADDR